MKEIQSLNSRFSELSENQLQETQGGVAPIIVGGLSLIGGIALGYFINH